MANTLTSLIPDLYEALDVVSRELVGFIPSVTLDAQAARASLNQTIRIPITPAATVEDATPGQLPPDDGDQTISNNTLSITKSRIVPFRWTGDEQLGINTGVGYQNIRRDQIAQQMRALTNEIETAVGLTAAAGASRAYGTAGSTPFASSLADPANVRKILEDNGAGMGDLQLVIDTTASVNMRSLTQLTKANEAGTADFRKQGTLMDMELFGFTVRGSAGVSKPAVGTGASYTTSTAGFAVGTTSIPVITGTGTILAGDIVTINGDTNQYVVATGVSAPGTIVLAAPGLRQAVPASAKAVTVVGQATRNVAFARSAIVLATRQPALPEEGDMADDRVAITDPRSGLTFDIAMYKQYRRVRYEMGIAYGVANIKPEHSALLLG